MSSEDTEVNCPSCGVHHEGQPCGGPPGLEELPAVPQIGRGLVIFLLSYCVFSFIVPTAWILLSLVPMLLLSDYLFHRKPYLVIEPPHFFTIFTYKALGATLMLFCVMLLMLPALYPTPERLAEEPQLAELLQVVTPMDVLIALLLLFTTYAYCAAGIRYFFERRHHERTLELAEEKKSYDKDFQDFMSDETEED